MTSAGWLPKKGCSIGTSGSYNVMISKLRNPTLARAPVWSWTAVALAIAAACGFVDYITGPEVALSVFYLLPISLAAWRAGLASGLAVALVSAVFWFLADFLCGVRYSTPWIPYWNAGVRLSFFVLTVHLICRT